MFRFGIGFVFIRLGLRLGLGARAGILRLDGDACDLLAALVRVHREDLGPDLPRLAGLLERGQLVGHRRERLAVEGAGDVHLGPPAAVDALDGRHGLRVEGEVGKGGDELRRRAWSGLGLG